MDSFWRGFNSVIQDWFEGFIYYVTLISVFYIPIVYFLTDLNLRNAVAWLVAFCGLFAFIRTFIRFRQNIIKV